MTWADIDGFFDFPDVYDKFVELLAPGDNIVEVGSYLGKSACYLGERIRASGKDIKLLCVDLWPDIYERDDGLTVVNPFGTFSANVHEMKLDDLVIPLRCSSVTAARLVQNGLGAVFIDAAHDYASVKDDIRCWKPKIRPGGFLAGHDYGDTYPGVKQAVDELLPEAQKTSFQCWATRV